MNDEVECPYCWCEVAFDYDDWFCYAEDELHELQCTECYKNFVFITSIMYSYESQKADCLNDWNHDYQLVRSWEYSKMRCTMCDDTRMLTVEEKEHLLK